MAGKSGAAIKAGVAILALPFALLVGLYAANLVFESLTHVDVLGVIPDNSHLVADTQEPAWWLLVLLFSCLSAGGIYTVLIVPTLPVLLAAHGTVVRFLGGSFAPYCLAGGIIGCAMMWYANDTGLAAWALSCKSAMNNCNGLGFRDWKDLCFDETGVCLGAQGLLDRRNLIGDVVIGGLFGALSVTLIWLTLRPDRSPDKSAIRTP